jgi:aminocarboxymuconate-semialdehyde decarboxylase
MKKRAFAKLAVLFLDPLNLAKPNMPLGKIDFHTHILPKALPDMHSKSGYGGWPKMTPLESGKAVIEIDGKFFREVSENCWNPLLRLEECDKHNVAIQVLSTVPVMFCYFSKREDARFWTRFLNDSLAETVRAHPKRFVGLGTLPMQNSEDAAEELKRCVKELGFVGAEIGTHVNGENLDEPHFYPFFAEAEKLGAILFVHPWDMLGKDRMQKYFLPWLVGMPAETSLAICSLIFGGVLEKFPKLKLVFAHGGGAFPASLGRIEQGFYARPDLCQTHIQQPPTHYLKQIYLDSLCHDAYILLFLIKRFGENQILLGSDYPFPLGEAIPGKLVESENTLNTKVKEKILRENALEFLGLKSRVSCNC